MTLKLTNNATSTLANSISNSDTSLVLASGEGSKFPSLSGSEYHPITVLRAGSPSEHEIMRVTARSTDTLTVTRGQEGTSAISFSTGDIVELRLTAGAADESLARKEDLGTASTLSRGSLAENATLRTAATKDTGTSSGQVPLNSDLGGAAYKAVSFFLASAALTTTVDTATPSNSKVVSEQGIRNYLGGDYTGQAGKAVRVNGDGNALELTDFPDLSGYVQVSDFASSMGTNGWLELPNGTIFQWGRVSQDLEVNVTFPIAFPTACRNVMVTPGHAGGYPGGDERTYFDHTTLTTTGVTIGASNGMDYIYWYATGY